MLRGRDKIILRVAIKSGMQQLNVCRYGYVNNWVTQDPCLAKPYIRRDVVSSGCVDPCDSIALLP